MEESNNNSNTSTPVDSTKTAPTTNPNYPVRNLEKRQLQYHSQVYALPDKTNKKHFSSVEEDILYFYKTYKNGLVDYYHSLNEKCERYRNAYLDYIGMMLPSQEITELGVRLKLYSFATCQFQLLKSEGARKDVDSLRNCLEKHEMNLISCANDMDKLIHRTELMLTNVAKIEHVSSWFFFCNIILNHSF